MADKIRVKSGENLCQKFEDDEFRQSISGKINC